MKLHLDGVTKGAKERILTETTLDVASGEAVLVVAETEQRPTVLGLIATGRMKPDSGTVLLDDSRKHSRRLRTISALVDAPDVSDPDANVLTIGVAAEELMFAGLPSHPVAARRWLDEHGAGDLALAPIGTVEPSRRIRMLGELAAERPGVELIVIVSPDRHGGRPHAWWRVAEDLAARGFAVLVIAGRASALALAAQHEAPHATEPTLETQAPELDAETAASDAASDQHPDAEQVDFLPAETTTPQASGTPTPSPAAQQAPAPPAADPTDAPALAGAPAADDPVLDASPPPAAEAPVVETEVPADADSRIPGPAESSADPTLTSDHTND